MRRASLASLRRSFKRDSQDAPSRKDSSGFVNSKHSSEFGSKRDSPDLDSSMGRVTNSLQEGDISVAVVLPEGDGIDDTNSSTHRITFSESKT